MKKVLVILMMVFGMKAVMAAENISVVSGTTPSHSGTPATMALIEEANKIQKKYNFRLEFRSGGLSVIALNYTAEKPQSRVVSVAPGFIDIAENGLVNANDWVPLFSTGDACWMVVSNLGDEKVGLDSLKGVKEMTVAGTGYGNAAHLTALMIGEKYGIKMKYVIFKNNYEGLITMASDNSANLLLERVSNVEQFKKKNPRIGMLAASCPARHPDAPNVKTLKEYGLDAPYVFQFIMAHKDMDKQKRKEIEAIFEQATKNIGPKKFRDLSDLVAPQFYGMKSKEHIEKSFANVRKLRAKYKSKINESK